MSNSNEIRNQLLNTPGTKHIKLEYLSTSNVVELIKQGKFYDLPADIIICHFDNVLKFYNWHLQKQEEIRLEKQKQLSEQFLATCYEEQKQGSLFLYDDTIDQLLNDLDSSEFK